MCCYFNKGAKPADEATDTVEETKAIETSTS